MEIHKDEAVIPVEAGDELGEVVVVDAEAELTVEFVGGFGGEGVIVESLDGGADVIGEEKVA